MTQSELFLGGEGDEWFRRNKSALFPRADLSDPATELVTETLMPFKRQINHVLEIGSGLGQRLYQICNALTAKGQGVEPSAEAVAQGNSSFDNIELMVGVAQHLEFDNEYFDLVVFGFCLYLVERDQLLQALSEADRVLRPGGFLAVIDFDPGTRYKTEYEHRQGVRTYKNSYPEFYLSLGHYFLVAKKTFSHHGDAFDPDPHERVSVSLLFKELDSYPERPTSSPAPNAD